MRRPAAICFDMAFTLLEHAPTGPDLYLRVLSQNGCSVTREQLEAAVRPARDFYMEAIRAGHQFESSMELAIEFWAEYNAIVLRALGMPGDSHADLAARIYTEAWSPAAWKLFPEVVGTLDELQRQGIRLAMVSNFIDTLERVCDHHGIGPYFDVILPSVSAGAMKPDPRIFATALRRLGVSADDAWHVGDNYWADIMGARAAGMLGILVDRERSVPHPDGPVIHSLDQLLDVVSAADGVAA